MDAVARNEEPETYGEPARETIAAFVERRNVQMVATFRGAGPGAGEWANDDPRATHWGVSLTYGGRQMHTEYHMGAGYWRWKRNLWGLRQEAVPWCNGKPGEQIPPRKLPKDLERYTEPIPPDPEGVLDSLRSDVVSVENARDFEDWAHESGYDSDSRKAEETYRACLKIRRELEALLGRAVLTELLECEGL